MTKMLRMLAVSDYYSRNLTYPFVTRTRADRNLREFICRLLALKKDRVRGIKFLVWLKIIQWSFNSVLVRKRKTELKPFQADRFRAKISFLSTYDRDARCNLRSSDA